MMKKVSKNEVVEYIFKRNEFLKKLGIPDIHDVDTIWINNARLPESDDYTITVSTRHDEVKTI